MCSREREREKERTLLKLKKKQKSMAYLMPYGAYSVNFSTQGVCVLLPSGAHLAHFYFKEVLLAHLLADRLIIYIAF